MIKKFEEFIINETIAIDTRRYPKEVSLEEVKEKMKIHNTLNNFTPIEIETISTLIENTKGFVNMNSYKFEQKLIIRTDKMIVRTTKLEDEWFIIDSYDYIKPSYWICDGIEELIGYINKMLITL